MKNSVWMRSALMPMPLNVGVFFSAKDFYRELKRMGIAKTPFTEECSDACVHSFINDKDGSSLHYMCIDLKKMAKMKRSGAYVMAAIVHECMHIWQKCCQFIGETSPSKEFEAYAMQHLFRDVLEKLEAHEAKR